MLDVLKHLVLWLWSRHSQATMLLMMALTDYLDAKDEKELADWLHFKSRM